MNCNMAIGNILKSATPEINSGDEKRKACKGSSNELLGVKQSSWECSRISLHLAEQD